MNKAYKILTKLHEHTDDFTIMSASTAGRAKTNLLGELRNAYPEENYSCIIYCRRSPEYDYLAQKYSGCLAWKFGIEHWEQDKGHWYEQDNR